MFATEPIREGDPEAGFSCGEPALDQFFRRHALRNDARGVGRTFVRRRTAADPTDLPALLGFYTLSMADLVTERLPESLRAGLPKYPMPVALIGRLAVDVRARGRGLGEELLADALDRILVASQQVGCLGVIVDAKTPRAEAFYEKYGFVTLALSDPFPRRMFLPLGTIADAAR